MLFINGRFAERACDGLVIKASLSKSDNNLIIRCLVQKGVLKWIYRLFSQKGLTYYDNIA